MNPDPLLDAYVTMVGQVDATRTSRPARPTWDDDDLWPLIQRALRIGGRHLSPAELDASYEAARAAAADPARRDEFAALVETARQDLTRRGPTGEKGTTSP